MHTAAGVHECRCAYTGPRSPIFLLFRIFSFFQYFLIFLIFKEILHFHIVACHCILYVHIFIVFAYFVHVFLGHTSLTYICFGVLAFSPSALVIVNDDARLCGNDHIHNTHFRTTTRSTSTRTAGTLERRISI